MTPDDRCKFAAEEMNEVLDRYDVTFFVDIDTYSHPAVFLTPVEDVDGEPPPKIH